MQNFWAILAVTIAVVSMVHARNSGQFTAPGCGPNSRFDDCSDGCGPTCDALKDEQCVPAYEGCVQECVCYRGYVKNPIGEGCIQESECNNL